LKKCVYVNLCNFSSGIGCLITKCTATYMGHKDMETGKEEVPHFEKRLLEKSQEGK
jgi:hypothetical protein